MAPRKPAAAKPQLDLSMVDPTMLAALLAQLNGGEAAVAAEPKVAVVSELTISFDRNKATTGAVSFYEADEDGNKVPTSSDSCLSGSFYLRSKAVKLLGLGANDDLEVIVRKRS